jgi:hypothetical protein
MTKVELIRKLIDLELMSSDFRTLVDLYCELQENEFLKWSQHDLENYAVVNWPEHFENSEFEQQA